MDSSPQSSAAESAVAADPAVRGHGLFYFALLAVLLAAIAFFLVVARSLRDDNGNPVFVTSPKTATTVPPTPTGTGTPATATVRPPSAPAGSATSQPTNDATVVACGDVLAPVDKQHALPAGCAPGDLQSIPGEYSANGQQFLRSAAAAALVEMFQAAAKDGHRLFANSGYRSYQTQVVVFNNEVAAYGMEQALRQSARPGHSEHQLGTTMDITSPSVGNDLVAAFGDTPEGKWLATNAANFGFVMSYPPGKEAITGYIYEPWHFRYVGKTEANAVKASGLTLHEYLLKR